MKLQLRIIRAYVKEFNIAYYRQFSPSQEEVEKQSALVIKALKLICNGTESFGEAKQVLFEAGKINHAKYMTEVLKNEAQKAPTTYKNM